ncbi:hypothetical protein JK162_09815 [Leuconostoc pseudomesenteroides]|uniref:hypothetical protein n=1 Tax=Leuconostoc pseudomesenteroides TaxID=33968 RepID=UPI001B8C8BB6|nr:hypothetical protein [Leuconostoc pseudomesenteroides]MBS0958769.1 hypothetical protein [Leuconostoc pseudomesenteroides]
MLEVSDEVEVEDEEGVTDDDTSLLSDDEVSIDEVSRLVVDVFLLVSIDDEDVVLTARDDARPPSVVPVATLTAKFAALIATISDTIADGVKKGGVLYFFAISSPLC